jgi:serine acetyltransferase
VVLGLSPLPDSSPTIGNRVDIGAGAELLGQISIAYDVAIGANAGAS